MRTEPELGTGIFCFACFRVPRMNGSQFSGCLADCAYPPPRWGICHGEISFGKVAFCKSQLVAQASLLSFLFFDFFWSVLFSFSPFFSRSNKMPLLAFTRDGRYRK